MAKILIFVLKYSINYVEIIKYKGGIKMAEINQESGVFGGISFENNMNQSGVVENAGTIRNEALPVKTGFWQKFKAFWLQDIDWNQEIRVELTPAQQKVEDEINEFLHQEITWEKVHDFLFQEITFGKKNK
jgi:hypothetical protein